MPGVDYYELLGVEQTASPAEIKSAYRLLAKSMHPDAGGTAGTFRLLQEAYDTLSDPDRRAVYDRTAPDIPAARTAGPRAAQPPRTRRPRRRFGEEPGYAPATPDVDPESLSWWDTAGEDELLRQVEPGTGHALVTGALAGGLLVVFMPMLPVRFSGGLLVAWLVVVLATGTLALRIARTHLATASLRRRYDAEFGSRAVFGSPGVEEDELPERLTAELLERYLTRLPGARIFHGLARPGSVFADIDHAVLCGDRLVLVESKLWLPGHYTVEDGRIFRNGQPFRGGASRLAPALDEYRRLLPGVRLRGALVLYPSRSGTLTCEAAVTAAVPPMTPEGFLSDVGGWLADQPSTVDIKAMRALRAQVVGPGR